MSKWNLTREYAGGEIVDTVDGSFANALSRKNELEKKNDGWKIIIRQTF